MLLCSTRNILWKLGPKGPRSARGECVREACVGGQDAFPRATGSVCCLPSAVCRLLSAVCCLLFALCCLLLLAAVCFCWLLAAGCWLLAAVCCLLSAVRCLSGGNVCEKCKWVVKIHFRERTHTHTHTHTRTHTGTHTPQLSLYNTKAVTL
jgi:hypothetical protein